MIKVEIVMFNILQTVVIIIKTYLLIFLLRDFSKNNETDVIHIYSVT